MSHQPNNIFAGTQVVSLVEVRGPNNSLVHPRGAVGVVTRAPAVEGEHFLVRFPDGFEKSLESSQIEVLKHFKDRLGDSAQQSGRPDSGFDLESCIIYRCVVGSRAYGLDNDESDTDRRGIYLAPADLQWSLFGAPEQFEDNATQSCYWELQKFIIMALRANPNILECLYSPMVEKVTPLGEELLALRQQFLSQMVFQTFNGYAMSQFKKIEQDIRNQPSREAKRKAKGRDWRAAPSPSPSAASGDGTERVSGYAGPIVPPAGTRAGTSQRDVPTFAGEAEIRPSASHGSEGIRWKHAMHLLRLLLIGAATLREARVPVHVESHRDRLLAVKCGEMPWTEVNAWRKELHHDLERALAETRLSERPDYEAANRFLIKARRGTNTQRVCG
ncbi:MAG TPA: nucleotidyltransferase domain-containing protein [Verrucomicrobiae bacterium]|jgi:hypothetical protein|nr:nucleotidyltransferase domain-containing protein [Verrucomicrobiae bacterium]